MGWAESIEWVLKSGDSPQKGEEWHWKKNVNEDTTTRRGYKNEIKIQQQDEEQKITTNITKTSSLPSKVPLLGVLYFWF